MGNSFNLYPPATALDVTYAFTFDVLRAVHVFAKINGVDNANFTLNTALTILTFDTPADIAEGDTIEVYRLTPQTSANRLVDFTDAAVLRSEDLDTAALQASYIAEEAFDSATRARDVTEGELILQTSGAWDAELARLKNLGAPTANNDAVRKSDLDAAALATGLLTTSQSAALNSAVPLGSQGGSEFRCLLSSVDVQENATDAGFTAVTSPASPATQDKAAHFYVDQGALSDGGTIRVLLSGRMSAESPNPSLNVRIAHNGTVFGHDDNGNTTGYNVGDSYNGKARVLRYPSPTRWILDVELISLGVNANEDSRHTTTGALTSGQNMLVRGELSLEEFSSSAGDNVALDFSQTRSNWKQYGFWRSAIAYAVGDTVNYHGESYICNFAHTSDHNFVLSSRNTPGESLLGLQYWRPKVLKTRINHMAIWDHSIVNEVTIKLGSVLAPDPDGYSPWLTATGYVVNDGVEDGGVQFVCHTAHTSGVAPTTDDDEWSVVDLESVLHLSTAQAFFFGGGQPGLRPLT